MTLYRYVREVKSNRKKRVPQALSVTIMTMGGALLLWVMWPILSFTITSQDLFIKTVTPISDSTRVSPVVFAAGEITNANAWFPALPQKKSTTFLTEYTLSIPKLKISDANVIIGGDDLSKSLIHYGGTATPGDYGNTVIFGHSTLPQFYNPKNYKTIFSTLPTLKEGDEIFVTYDSVSYVYKIFDMTVTTPSDLSALEQKFDDSYITLVTCVPPGTYWQRLNVKARIVRLNP